ncbi:MAG: putative Ig domain-containing protein [Pseudomonadota bacterium]
MLDFGIDILRSGYDKPTSIQFVVGEDGTIYLITSQQNGTITVSEVTSTGTGENKTYSEEIVFETTIINTIKNHNDDGTLATNTNNRQVTGFHAGIDENGDIELYVTSSDPRIGGGGKDNVVNKNVDTNSGVISKVTINVPGSEANDGDWSAAKIDLVRGIPRSEENHSINGVDFTPDGKLLVMVGGFANAGAPSQNLVYTPEYFLSGTLLEVDVAAIEALDTKTDSEGQQYKYDLPTLGIQRGEEGDGRPGAGFSKRDDGTPWGGNDGYNQSYLAADGPIEIFATGFRNGYDVEVVTLEPGDPGYSDQLGADNFRVYVWDNGANNGWGEAPANADGQVFSTHPNTGELAIYDDGSWKDIVIQEDGEVFIEQGGVTGVEVDTGSGPVFLAAERPDNIPLDENNNPISPGSQDNLHFVERGGYYGSPNLFHANEDAILYLKPELEGGGEDESAIPAPEFTDENGNIVKSVRDYLPPELNGDPLNGFEPSPLSGFFIKPKKGGGPIDDALVLNGGSTNGIVVFEYIKGVHPEGMEEFDGDLFATGFDEQIIRVDLSDDGKTALNRTEIENDAAFVTAPGANPLDVTIGPDGSIWVVAHGAGNVYAIVPGGEPFQETANDDDDQLLDVFDPFQLDPLNGTGEDSKVSPGEILEFTMENEIDPPNGDLGFAYGFQGHMVNYDTEYFTAESGVTAGGLLDGGIAGKAQIEADAVFDGSAEGISNDIRYAIQAGVNYEDSSKRILIESDITNVWTEFNQEAGQSQGIFIGTGTQFDFAAFTFAINDSGDEVVRAVVELNDVVVFEEEYAATGMTSVDGPPLLMRIVVDREAHTLQAVWEFETPTGLVTGQSDVIDLDVYGDNNLTDAIVQAGQGGHLARGAPSGGERSDPIFSNLSTDVFVNLGLAVGIMGRVEQTEAEGGKLFTPEFDNLLVTASDEQGDFAPEAQGEIVGSVEFGETFIIDVASLLANDRSFEGGTLSVSAVEADGQGVATLINDGQQVAYTPASAGDTGFTYTVADSESGAVSTAKAEVGVTAPSLGGTILYRVNAGSGTVAAADDGPDWLGDTGPASQFVTSTGPSSTFTQGLTNEEAEMDLSNLPDPTAIPWQLFTHERSDKSSAGNLAYTFDVDAGATYAVTIYYVENWNGIFASAVDRIFDVSVNGTVPAEFDDIHPLADAADALGTPIPSGDLDDAAKQPYLGTAFARTVLVTPETGQIELEFLPGSQNPKINAIEIRELVPVENGPSVSISSGAAVEGDAVIFTLDLSETADELITATYEIVPGTAEPGVDYSVGDAVPDENGIVTGTVEFSEGSADGSITVNTIDNETFDGDRAFTINITGVSGANAVIGAASATGTITEDDAPAGGPVVFALNAGASSVTDGAPYGLGNVDFVPDSAGNPYSGVTWNGEANNSNTNGDNDVIAGDLPQLIFESERWAKELNYAIPLENGAYVVELYFAETYVGVAGGGSALGAGTRVFDVSLEGGLVLDDFDLYDEGDGVLGNGEGAPLIQYVKTFNATVTDGVLDINLEANLPDGKDNAKISAIVVRQDLDQTVTSTISIQDAPTVAENGDGGTSTTVTFPIEGVPAAAGEASLTVEITVNGQTGAPEARTVTFDETGQASLEVAFPNDDQFLQNTVEVTLLSVETEGFVLSNSATSAIGTVTDDDDSGPSPIDIDGDGVLNIDDPFAYDASNGGDKVLEAGQAFTQTFEVDTTDPFSPEAGFSGILVNEELSPPGTSESDPYGTQTSENKFDISGGTLNVGSSNQDTFGDGGTAGNNTVKDNYQSAVDVTGVDTFEVVSRAVNPWFGEAQPLKFAQLGIQLGAGGVDEWVKLVFGGSSNPDAPDPSAGMRIELASQGSLSDGNTQKVLLTELPELDPATIAEIEFKLTVDKTAGSNGTVTGEITFFAEDGSEIATLDTPAKGILAGGSLEAALNGENPLTGGTGGLAYGIAITDFSNATAFTGSWKDLTIRSLDGVVSDVLITLGEAPDTVEAGDIGTSTLVFTVNADSDVTGDVAVTYDVDGPDGLQSVTETISLINGVGQVQVTVDNDDIDDGADAVSVTLTGVSTDGFALGDVVAASASVTEDEFNTPFSESVSGDLSGDNLAPTDLKVALGDNLITSAQQGNPDPTPDDRDFFTITVPEGQVLEALILQSVSLQDTAGFIGFMDGPTFDADIEGLETNPEILPSNEGVVGGYLYDAEDQGTDILPSLNGIGLGFPVPLPAGTYTFWLNQNGPASETTLNFQLSEVGSLSIGDAPTIAEGGDDGADQLLFAITTTPAKTGEVELTYDKTIGEVTVSETQTVLLDETGAGTLTIDVDQDDEDTGDTSVAVTLTSTTSTAVILDTNAASAAGIVTEDDAEDTSDLDEDGVANAVDAAYLDPTNGLATVLEAGGSISLEFNAVGPVDPLSEGTGLGGVNVNPNVTETGDDQDPYLGLTTGTGVIENGLLTVTSTNGDSFNDKNASTDDYGFMLNTSATDSFTVTSRIVPPEGGIPAVKFAAFGIQIGDGTQESYIKVARASGNNGQPIIDIRWDNDDAQQDANPAGGSSSQSISLNTAQAAAASYILSIDVDRSDPANITVTPRIQPLDADEAPIGAEIVAQTFTVTGDIADAINGLNPSFGDAGGGLFVGAYSTDFSNAQAFDASWDYIRVLSTETVDTPPTVDAGIGDQSVDEDAAYSFVVPADAFADDGGAEGLTLEATLLGGSELPAWLTFDASSGTFSGTPENGDVGTVSVTVTATDSAGQSVAESFDLTVNNTNDAPTVSSTTDAATATAGQETIIDLAPFLTFEDVDAGDVVTPLITASDLSITVDGTTVTVPASLAAGEYTITVGATDAAGAPAETLDITLTVDPAPDTQAPTASFAAIDTVTDVDAPIIVSLTLIDETALNPATVEDSDVTLSGPGVTDLPASAFAFDPDTGIATYTFNPPVGGWSEGDFTATLAAGAVADAAGNLVAEATVSASVEVPLPDITVSVIADPLSVAEAVGAQATFTVTLSQAVPDGETVEVAYTVGEADDTADAGTDYVAQSGTLTLTGGESEQTITVDLINDEITEDAETLSVVITGATLGGEALTLAAATATATIDAETTNEGMDGDETITVLPSDEVIDVSSGGADVISGPAEAFDDVTIKGFEDDDTVAVSGATGAEIVDVRAGSTIVGVDITGDGEEDVAIVFDDLFDPTPSSPLGIDDFVAEFDAESGVANVRFAPQALEVFLIEAGDYSVSEADEEVFTFTVALSEAADEQVTVTYAVTGDVDASDYRLFPPAELVFEVGETEAQLLLEIGQDDLFEADELLTFSLVSTSAGQIDATRDTANITITNDDEDTPITSEPIVLEAENFTGLDDSAFFAQGAGDASENALIRLNVKTESTVTTELPEGVTPGIYTIAVTYFDESDGQSTASIAVGDATVGSWVWNNDGPGNAAQAENLRTIEFKQVAIEEGDTFSLTGLRGDGEFVRVDKVTFTRTADAPQNQAPTGTDIPDLVEVGAGETIDVPFAYTDPENETVTVTATLSNGDPLPEGITLSPTGLTGTAPVALTGQSIEITVTASDPQNASLVDTFTLQINDVTAPEVALVPTAPATPTDPISIAVDFIDAGGLDEASAELTDFALTGPDGEVAPTSVAVNFETGTLEAIFDAPDSGWTTGDYTISMVDGALSDLGGNASLPTLPVTFAVDGIDPALPGANLDQDFDADGTVNAEDGDIDEDGIVNLADRFAYDADNGDAALSDLGTIEIDLAGLAAGDSPFTAGFTGVMPAFGAQVELDYATNNGAAIVSTDAGNRLVVESSPTDTNNGQAAFTFGAKVSDDFTLSGTFDNPYFGGTKTPIAFEQYGLLIGIDGGTFVKFVTGNPGADFELSGKTENVNIVGQPGKTSPLADKATHAATKLDVSVSVTPEAVVFTGTWTTLDADGTPLETGGLDPLSLTSGALFDAIQAGDVPVAFGITHTQTGGADEPFPVSLSELALVDGNVDTDGPTALLSTEGPATANDALVITVTYDDASGIDAASIDGDELELTSNTGDVFGAPEIADLGDGVFTYTYAAPDGGWTGTSFSAALVAGSVADTGGILNEAGLPIDFGRGDVDEVAEILATLDNVDTGGSYDEGDTGSVILTVMANANNVRQSNFSSNSFQLTNTGDKQVAAVLIDVRGAIYGDSVFDKDGTAGDTATKLFKVDSETGDGTGAYFEANAGSYVLPGTQPIPNTSGEGKESTGGFRGLLVKFDGSDGGFENGETVGFAGDMDPNSIAGLLKGSGAAIGVDDGALDGWDVGGVSGAELIGSRFIVVFDDGSTAEGYLHSDGSLAGSVGEAVEGRPTQTVSVTVDGFAAGDSEAVYGGTEPVIEVTGEPGATVRVVLTKGFNPVTVETNGIADIVANRLATQHPDFPANNAFDFQTVDIVIGANGKALVPINAFDYNEDPSNVDIPDAGIQPIAVTAAVVVDSSLPDSVSKVAVGPVADVVYLTNPTGTPVVPAEPPEEPQKIFQAENGTVVFEAESADREGTTGWVFETTEEASNENPDPSGDGYIIWEGNNSFGNPAANSTLDYTFTTDQGGNYVLKGKFGRRVEPSASEANDVFVRLVDSEGNPVNPVPVVQGGETRLHVKTGETIDVENAEFDPDNPPNGSVLGDAQKWMKFYIGGVGLNELKAGGQNGDFGGINVIYDLDPNETYTLQIAGRSKDFEIDKLALSNKGAGAATSAANNTPESDFIITGPTEPRVDTEINDLTVEQGNGLAFTIPANAFADDDGDALVLSAPNLPAGFTFVNGVLQAPANLAIGTYPITIFATDDDQNFASQTFDVVVTEEIVQQDFSAITLSAQDDIELGSSLNSNDLETDKIVQIRLTVQDGVSNVTSVDSALINWVAERNQGGNTTLTFQVEDTKAPGEFETNKDFVDGSVQTQITANWQNNQVIEDVVDIADLVNALIASQGPLNSGDVINLQMTGQGATRFIEHISVTLDLSTSGGSSGGGNSAPVVVNPIANADVALDGAVNIDLSGVFTDVDGDELSLGAAGLPNGVSLQNGALVGAPTEAGTFTVSVTASDGQEVATTEFTLTVSAEGNTPPAAGTPLANQSVETGEAFAFTVPASAFTDSDGDPLTLSIAAPAGFTANGATVTAPAGLAPGSYPITVTATDPDGAFATQTFTVTVTAPVETGDITLWLIDAVTDQRIRALNTTDVVNLAEVQSGQYNIEAEFNGAGADSVLFFVNGSFAKQENGAPYALLADSNGNFKEVDLPPSGTVQNIGVEVYSQNGGNGDLLAASTFNITFAEGELPNQAPVTTNAVEDDTVALGASVNIDVSSVFSDPDGDTITVQASGLPQGLGFNGTTISGAPTTSGTFNITLTGSDGEFSASDTFVLTVLEDLDTSPEPDVPITNKAFTNDEAFSFTVPANAFDDADGDPLTVSISAPPGVTTNGATVAAPIGLAAGTYTISVTATDPDNNSAVQTFTVTVSEPPESAVELWLVEPETDQLIRKLSANDVIGANELLDGEYNIAAIYTGPETPGSARMFLDGQQLTLQNGAPYALFNDNNGDYNGEALGAFGSQATFSATIYAQKGGKGAVLGEAAVTVTFAAEAEAPAPQAAFALAGPPSALGIDEDSLEPGETAELSLFETPDFQLPGELAQGLSLSPVPNASLNTSLVLQSAVMSQPGSGDFGGGGMVSQPFSQDMFDFNALMGGPGLADTGATLPAFASMSPIEAVLGQTSFDFGGLTSSPDQGAFDAYMDLSNGAPIGSVTAGSPYDWQPEVSDGPVSPDAIYWMVDDTDWGQGG